MTAETGFSRREFFTRAGRLVVLLPAGAALVNLAACGGSSSNDCAMANAVVDNAGMLTVTSSCTGINGGHTHDFSIPDADLASPPGPGFGGNSTPYDDDQHTHTVMLQMVDLANIQAGQTVTITSGSTLNHTHVFAFKKA